MTRFRIDGAACIGCGVSSSVAPGHVRIGERGTAELVDQPASAADVKALDAAALLCPVGAIRRDVGR